jgi:hypothetical protein
MNLPTSPDWNINPSPDYCSNNNNFDSYAHCSGAKLWIVPTSDLTSGALPLTAWNPTTYLFETDLVTYSSDSISICNQESQCVLIPKTCGITASGPITFGSIIPGTATDGDDISIVSNSGNTPASLGISGTDWTPYMLVGQTSWSVDNKVNWNTLTGSDVSTGASVSALGTKDVNFQLTVPTGQATGTYSQIITFTGSC